MSINIVTIGAACFLAGIGLRSVVGFRARSRGRIRLAVALPDGAISAEEAAEAVSLISLLRAEIADLPRAYFAPGVARR